MRDVREPARAAPVWPRVARRACAAAALLFVAALQVHALDDGDTWWHLASGRRIATTHSVAHVDPFSYTAPGAPWINRQWLFELAAYGAWRAGAATGVALAAGACFLAGFAAMYATARRRLPAWAAGLVVFLAANAAIERFTARPEAVTFCLLAAYVWALDAGRVGAGVVLALLAAQVVWANSHALSVLGVAVLGRALVGSVLARRTRDVLPLAIATAGAAAAELATPFGLAGALFPLRLLGVLRGGEVTSAPIVEHRPTALGELSPTAAAGLVALLVLAGLALLLSYRRWRPFEVILAGAFVWLAFVARRNVALVGPAVVPLIASGLAPALGAVRRRAAIIGAVASALALGIVLATAGVVSGRYYDAARLTRTFGVGESPLTPARAVDFLEARHAGARLFNDDGYGGYLLWRGRPVFIDGRLQVYPAAVYAQYQGVLDDPASFPALAARWDIGAAILFHPAPGRLELARAIARLPGWGVAYLDAGAVVLVSGHDGGSPLGLRAPPAAGTTRDEVLLRYQRGRAALYLLGRDGAAAAADDFREALRLSPAFDDARVGLEAAERVLRGG